VVKLHARIPWGKPLLSLQEVGDDAQQHEFH
jgi:hypothetical protein